MECPKISIIIPVYKVEQYIEKCARTLFAQTLDNLEFIFIDDCSPDNSIDVLYRVLDEFPMRKNQVKFIRHKKNEGVAKSRQDGIDSASGEYIIHCDPDDWIELDMYKSLYEKAKVTGADLVLCDFNYVNERNEKSYSNQRPDELQSISLLENVTGRSLHVLHGCLWNKMIKAINYKGIDIPSDISYSEDQFILLQILTKELKIEYINKSFYYYRNNPKSIVNTITSEDIQKDINLINYLQNIINKSENHRYAACCKSLIISVIFYRYFLLCNLSNKKFKNYFHNYKDYIKEIKRINIYEKLVLRLSMNGYLNYIRPIYYRWLYILYIINSKILKKNT